MEHPGAPSAPDRHGLEPLVTTGQEALLKDGHRGQLRPNQPLAAPVVAEGVCKTGEKDKGNQPLPWDHARCYDRR